MISILDFYISILHSSTEYYDILFMGRTVRRKYHDQVLLSTNIWVLPKTFLNF
jgi:hypothetical protein